MSFELNIVGNDDIRLNADGNKMLTELIVKKLTQELSKKPKKEGRRFARG